MLASVLISLIMENTTTYMVGAVDCKDRQKKNVFPAKLLCLDDEAK